MQNNKMASTQNTQLEQSKSAILLKHWISTCEIHFEVIHKYNDLNVALKISYTLSTGDLVAV